MDEKITTNHDVIRQWAEKHQATPQIIDHSGENEEIIALRLDFPGKEDDIFLGQSNKPRNVSWEEFFQKFEDHDLAFSYHDTDATDPSLAYHFVRRDSI